MNKEKLFVRILSVLFILNILAIILCTIFPMKESQIISDSHKEWVRRNVGETNKVKIDTKDKEISGFMFYAPGNRKGIELEIKIYNDKETLYHNYFFEVNKTHNIIYLPKNIKNTDSVTLEYKINKIDIELRLANNNDDNIRLDQIVLTKTYTPILWEFITLIGITISLLYVKNKNDNDNKMSNKKNILCYIIYFVSSLIVSFGLLHLAYEANYKGKINLLWILGTIILVLLICYLFKKLHSSNGKKYEHLFLIIAIPLSCIYCVLCMPEDAPDEFKHFSRAYSYTIGEVKTKDGTTTMPEDVIIGWYGMGNVDNLHNLITKNTDYSKTQRVDNMAYTYNPTVYTGNIIGITAGRLLNINSYIVWYICKIINTIAFLVVGFISVKMMPKFKLLTILTLLMPITLYQVTSVSSDAMIIINSFFLISYFINMYYSNKKFTFRSALVILICGSPMIFGKPVYMPIIIGLLILNYKKILEKPKKIFSNYKNILLAVIPVMVLGFGYILWNKYIAVPTGITSSHGSVYVGSSGIIYTICHPFATIGALFNYIINSVDAYLLTYVGYKFVWETQLVPVAYPCLYFIIIALAILFRDDEEDMKLFPKLTLFISGLCTFLLTIYAIYAIEYRSNVLTGDIWGVQGRYLIPVLILMFMGINKINISNNKYSSINKTIIIMFFVIHLLYILKLLEFAIV